MLHSCSLLSLTPEPKRSPESVPQSGPRLPISVSTHVRASLLSVTSDLQVCNQVHVPHQQHGSLPTIPCLLNSSMRDNSPSAPAKSEYDHQRLLQNKCLVLPADQHTHTHCPHTHVASPLAARNTLLAKKPFYAHSLCQCLSGLVHRPALPFVFSLL